MVDLHVVASALTPDEGDLFSGIGVHQDALQDDATAGPRLDLGIDQIATEDVVARVATVAVDIGPARPELVPGVAGLRGTALHRQRLEDRARKAGITRSAPVGRGRHGRCRAEDDRERAGRHISLGKPHGSKDTPVGAERATPV